MTIPREFLDTTLGRAALRLALMNQSAIPLDRRQVDTAVDSIASLASGHPVDVTIDSPWGTMLRIRIEEKV